MTALKDSDWETTLSEAELEQALDEVPLAGIVGELEAIVRECESEIAIAERRALAARLAIKRLLATEPGKAVQR